MLGTTEFRIRVGHAAELLPGKFLHDLSVLKHIALAIPAGNRWDPVFERYLGELGGPHPRIRRRPRRRRAVADRPPAGPTAGRAMATGMPMSSRGRVVPLVLRLLRRLRGLRARRCDERRHFATCDCGIEKVALTACEKHLRMTVLYDRATHRPKHLVLHCC